MRVVKPQSAEPPKQKLELNVVKANEKIEKLEASLATLKATPKTSPRNSYPEATFNGKTVAEIVQAAETKANLKAVTKEVDATKRASLMASILKDPRLHHLGKHSSVGNIEAEMLFLAKQDAAKKELEGTLAQQRAAKSANQSWNVMKRNCTAPVYLLTKVGYSLCFDTNGSFERVFIKANAKSDWAELVKTGEAGNAQVVGNYLNASPLSKAEFTAILESKPALDKLYLMYSNRFNYNVTIEGKTVIPLW